MARSRFFVVAAFLAVGAAGCAHCDTCDDMPVPCSGPGCSAALRTVGPPMTDAPMGPFSTSAASPSLAPADSSGGSTTGSTFTPPPLPDVPADPPSPPPGPSAPDKP